MSYRYSIDVTWWETSDVDPSRKVEAAEVIHVDGDYNTARSRWYGIRNRYQQGLPAGRERLTLSPVRIWKVHPDGKRTPSGDLDGTETVRVGWPPSDCEHLTGDELRAWVRRKAAGAPIGREVPA